MGTTSSTSATKLNTRLQLTRDEDRRPRKTWNQRKARNIRRRLRPRNVAHHHPSVHAQEVGESRAHVRVREVVASEDHWQERGMLAVARVFSSDASSNYTVGLP